MIFLPFQSKFYWGSSEKIFMHNDSSYDLNGVIHECQLAINGIFRPLASKSACKNENPSL